jgi:hypothetical protein
MDFNRLPNLFIIGAVKSGTTTLYDTLAKYPGVYFPVQKEPSFFCDEEYFSRGVEWYLQSYYSNAEQYQVRGDASPRYLYWSARVAPRLASLYAGSSPKFIAILRNPVEMVYSFYWQSVREGRERLTFREALQEENARLAEHQESISRKGRLTFAYGQIADYAAQLQPFLERFPKKRFLFLLTEDFKDFSSLTCKLEEFLNLEHIDWTETVRSNVSRLPRSRWLHKVLVQRSWIKNILKAVLPYSFRHRLKTAVIDLNLKEYHPEALDPDLVVQIREHYKPELIELEKIIQRDLSSWYSETDRNA